VPLRDVETTWRLAIVGVPDGGSPRRRRSTSRWRALSARIDAGAAGGGRRVAVAITVRNRSAQAVSASLSIGRAASRPRGATRPGEPLTKSATVPAEGRSSCAPGEGAQAGTARLDVRLRGQGAQEDLVSHRWEVRAPGEPTDFTSARWVDDEASSR